MSEQRDGTGTGTWTHPAAEPGQPEPKRCECGMCVWNGHRWTIAKSHNGEPGIALWGNDKGDVVCPGDCKCRLCVVDGQPIVRPPEPRRCECGACWWDGVQWVTRYFEAGDSPEMHSELVVPVAHCPGSCGCRLSVEAGEPRVGLSTRQVLYELMSAISEQLECARWYQGVEHYLWACVQNLKNTQITDAERLALQQLSAMAGGWWAWDYDNPEPTFLPMAEWLALYSTGGDDSE